METAGKIFLGLVVTLTSLLVIALLDTIEPGWSADFRNGADWLYIKFWVFLVFGSALAGIGYGVWVLFRMPNVRKWCTKNGGNIVAFVKTHRFVISVAAAIALGITAIVGIVLFFT